MDSEKIHTAYTTGDVDALRAALGNPPDFPHTRDSCGETCLGYALYHAPLSLVRSLLELGADPNEEVLDGFPSLFAALNSNHPDRCARVSLLLDRGADIQQRGVNDYTPLHFAATQDNTEAVALLLKRGADPSARTRIDNYATALQEAERFGHEAGAAELRRLGINA